MGGVAFHRACQGWRRCRDHRDPGDFEEAQEYQVHQEHVARGLVDDAVDAQEGGSVRRFGARPEGVAEIVEGGRAQDIRTVGVRIDVVAHHFALRGVGIDVAAEERRRQHQGKGPDHDDEHHPLNRESRMGPQQSKQAHPDPREKNQPSEDEREGDNGWHGVVRCGRAEQATGHAEEPRARQMGLEGLTAEHGPHDQGGRPDRTEECGPSEAHGWEPGRGIRVRRRISLYGLVRHGGIELQARGDELHR